MLKAIYPNGMVLVYERAAEIEHRSTCLILRDDKGRWVATINQSTPVIIEGFRVHDHVEFIRPLRAERPARPKARAPRRPVLRQVQF